MERRRDKMDARCVQRMLVVVVGEREGGVVVVEVVATDKEEEEELFGTVYASTAGASKQTSEPGSAL